MRDEHIASFLSSLVLEGSILQIPKQFFGSYLAVVNANIGGEKTDAFMTQTINAEIDVDTESGILTNLTITRTHSGNTKKESWWNAPNKNYLQVLTTPQNVLIGLTGNDQNIPQAKMRYEGTNYRMHDSVQKLEENTAYLSQYRAWSGKVSGKAVFGTWVTTKPGKTSTTTLRYQDNGARNIELVQGKEFTLLFQSQAGVKNNLNFVISAPLGYIWRESKNGTFRYQNENPEKNIEIKLTLDKRK